MNTGSLAPQLRDVAGSSLLAEDRFDYAAAPTEGDDLESLVEQTGPMPPDAATECMRQALGGLAHAHEQRLAHGDLTASDLILDFDGVLRIAHLGGAPSTTAEEFSAAAAQDLRRLAGVLCWLLVGQKHSPTGNNGLSGNGHECNGGATVEWLQVESEAPESLATLYRRLAAAGSLHGFASAAQALSFLENGETAVEALAAPCTCGAQDSTCCADAVAAPLSWAPPLTATPSSETPLDMAPLESSSRGRAWLWGSIALTVAMLLALVSYLLWN